MSGPNSGSAGGTRLRSDAGRGGAEGACRSERSNGSPQDGIGPRLRRFQERFEPLVTRLLLLGIFVTGLTAQFVKPVGDALEGKAYLGGALLSARMRLHQMGDEYYDPKGYRTDLNVWSRRGSAAAEAAVSTWNKHFDCLWALARRPDWRRGVPA
jgi:hypothetical protein